VLFVVWGLIVINVIRHSKIDEKHKVDAIVVMGASQWNGRPSPAFKERLDHALLKYNEGLGEYLIITGGIAEGESISESSVGRKYLGNKGVSNEVILIEESGLNSLQSLKEVQRILQQRDLNTILLVSHGYHMMRIKHIANDLNIEKVYSSPVASRKKENRIKYILRESVVFIAYYLSKINPSNRN